MSFITKSNVTVDGELFAEGSPFPADGKYASIAAALHKQGILAVSESKAENKPAPKDDKEDDGAKHKTEHKKHPHKKHK